MTSDRTFPPLLAQLLAFDFDYGEGDGIDFEAYDQFEAAADTMRWIRAWTGNQTIDGAEYRVFGQDGTGGYAAFFLRDPGAPLFDQPIVFFGSEGEVGPVASNFSDLLWLFGDGVGPKEAVELGGGLAKRLPTPELAAFAAAHATGPRKTAKEVIAAAAALLPDFASSIRALCG